MEGVLEWTGFSGPAACELAVRAVRLERNRPRGVNHGLPNGGRNLFRARLIPAKPSRMLDFRDIGIDPGDRRASTLRNA